MDEAAADADAAAWGLTALSFLPPARLPFLPCETGSDHPPPSSGEEAEAADEGDAEAIGER